MTSAGSQEISLLGKLVLAIGILLFVTGVIWHGVTLETFARIWEGLIGRLGGPMKFRFILQPSMAAIAAIHDAFRDAGAGRSPYFWTILKGTQLRAELLREGLNATARIILLALAMDVIYQLLVLKTFYPAEAPIVALLFAVAPYLIIRGAALRVIRRWRGAAPPHRIP